MSGYQQQGGHYDEGYGHPAGQGDSYYQDEHAAQGGYYDHQDYGDGYYDRGYGHL
jgi:1,3-beta-glucan synthase